MTVKGFLNVNKSALKFLRQHLGARKPLKCVFAKSVTFFVDFLVILTWLLA